MDVQINQISIRGATHDPGFRLRVFLEEAGEIVDEWLLAIRHHRIVLFVAVDDDGSALRHLVLVEDGVVKIDHQLAVGFFLNQIALGGFRQNGRGHQRGREGKSSDGKTTCHEIHG